ncbi:hypothetical protein HHI36_006235 [Cryptolaemus montrouzieri]|uniref:Endonuclease-reverse transcriptase n=1 Tax=Cryptolaemus montrouzieri TaxID=559131 RepID=A0ABD2NWG9_9CUCU
MKRKTRTENIQNGESLAKLCTETAEDILGTVERKRKKWISDETWNPINELKRIKGETSSAHTMETKAAAQRLYQKMNKRVIRAVRRDKIKWAEKLSKQVQTATQKNNAREL